MHLGQFLTRQHWKYVLVYSNINWFQFFFQKFENLVHDCLIIQPGFTWLDRDYLVFGKIYHVSLKHCHHFQLGPFVGWNIDGRLLFLTIAHAIEWTLFDWVVTVSGWLHFFTINITYSSLQVSSIHLELVWSFCQCISHLFYHL